MALLFVTCVCDEGFVSPLSFRVFEAESRLAIAESMVTYPYKWFDYLRRSQLWEGLHEGRWRPEELLKRIDRSSIDGDSRYQLAIHEVTRIETVHDMATIERWTD